MQAKPATFETSVCIEYIVLWRMPRSNLQIWRFFFRVLVAWLWALLSGFIGVWFLFFNIAPFGMSLMSWDHLFQNWVWFKFEIIVRVCSLSVQNFEQLSSYIIERLHAPYLIVLVYCLSDWLCIVFSCCLFLNTIIRVALVWALLLGLGFRVTCVFLPNDILFLGF